MSRRTETALYAVSALLLIGTATIWWQGIRPSPREASELQPVGVVEEATSRPEETQMICVHIAGAVKKPGVYQFPQGHRLFQALELVGLNEDADLSGLNLASVLRDSQKVHVPALGESQPPQQSGGAEGPSRRPPGPAFPLDLNSATQSELEQLPGIGPVLARAIIARRDEVGPFQRPEDLLDVSGIGAKTLEKIIPYVTVK